MSESPEHRPVLARLREWHVLGIASLSNRTLTWFAPIGILAVVLAVPGQASLGALDWRWWLTAFAAQAAFSVVVTVSRARARSVVGVAVVLVLGGAVRGLVTAAVSGAAGVVDPLPVAERMVNSAVISVLWCALIGGIVEWSASYAQQYQLLVDRAVAIERANRDGDNIDPATLLAWSDVRASVDDIVRTARGDLAGARDGDGLREVALAIRRAIDIDVRPASHRLWPALDTNPPTLRWRELVRAALDPWQPPCAAVLMFFGVILAIGALMRMGLAGLLYTACVLVATWLVLTVSSRIARGSAHQIAAAVIALLMLSIAVFVAGGVFELLMPSVPRDLVGALVVVAMAPVVTVAVAVLVRLVAQRHAVLAALQARIDTGTVSQLAHAAQAREDAARLGAYVHHSVQSELAALALQLSEAAQTGDPLIVETVRERVLDRLTRMMPADDAVPPWLRVTSGPERIADVAAAWEGIVDVMLDLDDETTARADQWDLAAQLVAEGVANAVRHGRARSVRVRAHVGDDGALVVSVDDDGASSSAATVPGFGSAWLDHVALDGWTRASTADGTTLVVRLP